MDTFGKRLADCRKAKNLSQKELAVLLDTSHTTIGKYERDEMVPSVQAAKRLAIVLGTTVGYLLEETDKADLFKDPSMLQRLQDIVNLPDNDKHCILYALDGLLQNVRTKQAFAK